MRHKLNISNRIRRAVLVPLVAAAAVLPLHGRITLNQVGFAAEGPKTAVVLAGAETSFELVTDPGGQLVHSGTLGAAATWAPSGQQVRLAGFAAVTQPGRYRVRVGAALSDPVHIANRPFAEVARAALRYFYFNRASTALEAEHAEIWSRPAGHPDTSVRVHASAASAARPAGTLISAPKGWYDAGDFNKYIVNSGISTYTLLLLYALFPEHLARTDLGIPESGGPLPDILAEIKWNLDWMLAMQDPADGGVYHKLTTLNFSGAVMPHAATAQRYVVAKSVTAAYDFAAVCACAARVYQPFDAAYAAALLEAAKAAYAWGQANPGALYTANPDGVNTGVYGDSQPADELRWAAAELYITTGEAAYEAAALQAVTYGAEVPGWPNVNTLAQYSLALFAGNAGARGRILTQANSIRYEWQSSACGVPMLTWNYYWGSNSVAANKGVLLLVAHRLGGDPAHLEAAVACLDYLLGRNPHNTSFVTGFGARSPMHPHHRASQADGIADPVPGMLAGGPNQNKDDGCPGYPAGGGPAMMWVDDWCSYASNEVAINWNAPLAFLAGALDATLSRPAIRGAFGPDLAAADGWILSPFGWIAASLHSGWIYHQRHGWMYSIPATTGTWLHGGLGWIWTAPGLFPHFYAASRADWFHYAHPGDHSAWIYWYASATWQDWAM